MKDKPDNSNQITATNNNHEISIIVPTLNKLYSHEKLGLEDQTARIEVIIILQDSDSENLYLKKEIKTRWGTAKYYTIKSRGTSKARNFGVDCATSDLIAFLDDDVRANRNYIDFLLDLFTTKNVSLLCCKIFYGETPPPCRMQQAVKPKSIIDVGGPGSGISLRRSTLLKNNIRFDERLGGGTQIICGEDTKLCIDAWKKNLKY